MAARAYWKGSLKLSLVTCPVILYPATTSAAKTRFHMINKETGNRLKQQMVGADRRGGRGRYPHEMRDEKAYFGDVRAMARQVETSIWDFGRSFAAAKTSWPDTAESRLCPAMTAQRGDPYFFDFRFLPALLFLLAVFFGTFCPAARASDRPIAIACSRLFTFRPERPLVKVPRLRSRIARATLDVAFFEYFRAMIFSPCGEELIGASD